MKRTKKQVNTYHLAAMAILNSHGAVAENRASSYDYTIKTTAGELRLSVHEDCSVCTRFVNVEKAKTLGLGDNLNPHSGKWNWMGGLTHDEDMADLLLFSAALRKIT